MHGCVLMWAGVWLMVNGRCALSDERWARSDHATISRLLRPRSACSFTTTRRRSTRRRIIGSGRILSATADSSRLVAHRTTYVDGEAWQRWSRFQRAASAGSYQMFLLSARGMPSCPLAQTRAHLVGLGARVRHCGAAARATRARGRVVTTLRATSRLLKFSE